MSEEINGTLSDEEIAEIAKARSYDYQLEFPIEVGDLDPIVTVTLKRFNGGQMRAIQKVKDDFDKISKMIELSTGLVPIQVDSMDVIDITQLGEICGVFMSASPRKLQKNIGGQSPV